MEKNGTLFAPAGRATSDEIKELVSLSLESPVLQVVLEAVSGMVMVLNKSVMKGISGVAKYRSEFNEAM